MNESIRTPGSHETTLAPDAPYGSARPSSGRADAGLRPASSPRPTDHPPVRNGRIGVLIVNLGTPDATDADSVRKYLKEFLSDRRVIEETGLIWKLVLNGIILRTRPAQKGRDYEKIWNTEKNESPLKTITRSQSDLLAAALAGVYDRLVVDWAMRYGNPSIESRLAALQAEGCDRILLVPLYPQYAAATTATVCDEAFRALMRMRWQPTLRVAHPWYDDPVYIDALARSIEDELAKLTFVPEVIIASFHGIPKEYFDKGDPYYCHCAKTHRLLRARLGMDEDRFRLTFQSRFGRAEWLQPYTDMTVKGLAESGVKSLAIVTPGFTSDCLETLEEIAGENAEIFHHAGGERFAAIPCLNDSAPGMEVIRTVVERELKGWVGG
ncbi:ferrochelatase [Rhodoplanes sp. TEM]|uniref:Ferrochelatase n=1 Tax=Rhodoplanes tepidamans TaxID=200616 RepID=A0ABT5J7M3_RHOTP|nr:MULTISPECIES: ferrochelatase [Rhodoplanes]MDC7785656.1 ferrochelatase [Rhodoplanes tepidamans]MDC7983297.1 ferrochelatase [Rhodoplanes sp. TEM]MDQ0354777.1 ferrochelatase [Rhodoplanes tepidamans]